MSISPPSDIVLDVLRASDPARQQAATQKLTRNSASRSSQGVQQVIRPTAGTPVRQSFDAELSNTQRSNRTILAGAKHLSANSAVGSAHRQFETMVLQDFVQRMLPAKAEAAFGQGTAGNVWKSWMADAVAKEISNAGGIGISSILQPAAVQPQLPSHPLPDNSVKSATKTDVVSRQVGFVSGLQDIIAKFQEIFLNVFGSEKSDKAGETDTLRTRPEIHV